MNTKLIGIKKFRQNISTIWKDIQKSKNRYIVMNHSVPILEVKAIDEENFFLESLKSDIKEARNDVKNGDVYSEEDMYLKLGLL